MARSKRKKKTGISPPRRYKKHGKIDRVAPKPITDAARKKCKSKIRFHRKTSAMRAAEQYSAKHGNDLVPYRCWVCGHWHLMTAEEKDDHGEAQTT